MKSVVKLGIMTTLLLFTVSCCFKSVPKFSNPVDLLQQQVPINPESVLFIVGMDMTTGQQVMGSGIIIESHRKETWALSAAHVCYPEIDNPSINAESKFQMLAIDFHGEPLPISQIGLDLKKDICIFKIESASKAFTPLADKMPLVGSRAFLGAFPLGTYIPGTIPLFEGFYSGSTNEFSEFTIPVAPGSSGGGIVNSKGEIIGIVSMKIVGFDNLLLAARLEDIHALLVAAKENPNRLTILW